MKHMNIRYGPGFLEISQRAIEASLTFEIPLRTRTSQTALRRIRDANLFTHYTCAAIEPILSEIELAVTLRSFLGGQSLRR